MDKRRAMSHIFGPCGWLAATWLLIGDGALAAEGTNVLKVVVLYQEQRMVPAITDVATRLAENQP